MLTRIDAVERDGPAGRRDQRRQHLNRCRLAGAVWTKKREDFTLGHVERDVVDRLDFAERLHQIVNVDHLRS
jgi:hypothetical protein